jgi:hypothetical protein
MYRSLNTGSPHGTANNLPEGETTYPREKPPIRDKLKQNKIIDASAFFLYQGWFGVIQPTHSLPKD